MESYISVPFSAIRVSLFLLKLLSRFRGIAILKLVLLSHVHSLQIYALARQQLGKHTHCWGQKQQ